MVWNFRALVLVLQFALSPFIFAESSDESDASASAITVQSPESKDKFRLYLFPMLMFDNKSFYELSFSDSNFASAYRSSSDLGSTAYSMELFYEYNPYVGASVIAEYAKYSYSRVATRDSMFSLLLMPRATATFGRFSIWGGFAIGPSFVDSDAKFVYFQGGIARVNHSQVLGITLSPRLGADFQINDLFFAGIQGSWHRVAFTLEGNHAASGGVIANSYRHSWLGAGARFGANL